MPTRRQQIVELLRKGPISVEAIARLVECRAKTVLADLEHIRRGLTATERWRASPAACLDCGFTYRDRERLNTPSRCPRCRSEDVRPPEFRISEGG